MSQEHLIPWYRQFWPWFLMALPASAVIAGISTVIIATIYKDSLVVDNYYKEGLAINQTLIQQQVAHELKLAARAAFNPVSGELILSVSSAQPLADPQLRLTMVHATLAERDQIVFLKKRSVNIYSAQLSDFTTGKWQLILEPADAQWRIGATLTQPKQNWILTPNM